jgi:hypothetical protein
MFAHAGFKPFWPVIFFLPWFIFGVACLLAVVLHRRPRAAAVQTAGGASAAADRRRANDLNSKPDSSARPARRCATRGT